MLYEYMKELGYSDNEIDKIINYHKLCNYREESLYYKIREIFNYLLGLGYKNKDIIKMTLELPSLYGLSMDNIREKWKFYNEIGLRDIFKYKTKYIMQSVELSYARYMFLNTIEIDISMSNYKLLFDCRNRFEKRFGKDSRKLLEIYKYDRDEFKKRVLE